ncbi:hypothetical protein ACWCYY_11945 [Kitasatospora sp. NPDC001664]
MDIWIPAIVGLVGAVVGALASSWTTLRSLAKQSEAARAERIAAEEAAAIDAMLTRMWDLEQHANKTWKWNPWKQEEDEAEWDSWGESLVALLGPVSVIIESVHGATAREEVRKALDTMHDWQTGVNASVKHPGAVVAVGARRIVAVLGAYRRGEQIPAEPKLLAEVRADSEMLSELAREAGA